MAQQLIGGKFIADYPDVTTGELKPAVGYKLYTYVSGTITPQATYSDAGLTAPNTNPVILDARGEASVFLTPGQVYTLVLMTSTGSTIWTRDGITSPVSTSDLSIAAGAGLIGFSSSASYSAGTVGRWLKDLTDATAPEKGAAMIGRAAQVVNSVADVRNLLKTSASKYATTKGYYGTATPGGADYYLDESDTTSLDNGGTIIVAADGGRWKMIVRDNTVSAYQFGAKVDGSTDDQPFYQAAVAYFGALGGGTILVPVGVSNIGSPIDVKYPRVRLVGQAPNSYHDSGTEFPRSIIRTAFAGTAIKIRTPYAAEQGVAAANTQKYYGAACVGVSIDLNNVGTLALLIDSVSYIDVDVYATGCVGTNVFQVTCGVSGTDLGEACDVQFSRMVFKARQIDTLSQKAANILRLEGSSNANVSLNRGPLHGISVIAQHWDGDVFDGISCDNNDISVVGIRPGGIGRTIFMAGPTAAITVGGESNNFVYVSGAGQIYAQGTDTVGVTAGAVNRIENLDTGNGTPTPTPGVGASWQYVQNDNAISGSANIKGAFGDSLANAKSARTNLGNETIRVVNGANNHVVLDNGTVAWGVNINSATGDFRINRLSGAGSVDIGAGVTVKINGKSVTEGAADSGGAGFKVLRVPN